MHAAQVPVPGAAAKSEELTFGRLPRLAIAIS